MLLFPVPSMALLLAFMIGIIKETYMMRRFFEMSLANYFNKYKQSNGTFDGSLFILSGTFSFVFCFTFGTGLLFFEKVFGWAMFSCYNNMFPSKLSAILPILIFGWALSYYWLICSNIQSKVCEKYSCADGYKIMFLLGILCIPGYILMIIMTIFS